MAYDPPLKSFFWQLHLRRAGVEGALLLVPQSLVKASLPKQRNTTTLEEERKKDEKLTSAASIDERIEVDVKKKGISGNSTVGWLRSDNLFPSNLSSSSATDESKNEDRSLIISEERLPLVNKDMKKKGLTTAGSSMKRLDSGSLFMSSSGSGSFHRNADPLGPLGNDLIAPQRVFMRPNGMFCVSLLTPKGSTGDECFEIFA